METSSQSQIPGDSQSLSFRPPARDAAISSGLRLCKAWFLPACPPGLPSTSAGPEPPPRPGRKEGWSHPRPADTGKVQEHLPGMSRRSAPLQTPGCPVSLLGQRRGQRSWPSRPGREGSAGRRLPGRFLPLACESVSLQPSPGRARSSSPHIPQTQRLSGRRGQGPGLAGGSAVARVSGGLLTWQLRGGGEGQHKVRVRAGGRGLGGAGAGGISSALEVSFTSRVQTGSPPPKEHRNRLCLPA